MASYNRIILVGNLTRDPVLSYTPANTAICKFGIATNRKWKDRDGNSRDEVCFVDCVLFGKAAETFNEYMGVGKPILIEGRLILDRWEDKDSGQKRSKHTVSVDNFTFLGDGGSKDNGAATKRPDEAPSPADDDIPF